MTEVELTKMSTRGQIVIPQDIRTEMQLKAGEAFAIARTGDTLVLKRVTAPSKEELLAELKAMVTEGSKHVKKLGIKEKDVNAIIHRRRKLK